MKKLQLFLTTTLALIGSAVVLHAGAPISIGVNFNGVDGSGIDNAQSDSLLTGEVAGAPTFAQTNWNNLDRYGSIASGIIDATGVDSGLQMQWDSVSSHSSGAFGILGTSDGKLMDGMNDTDWAGGPPSALTASSTYGAAFNQKPLVYLGGIQAWLASKGASSYSVVLYVQGWHGWGGTSEHWVQSVTSGSALSFNMVPGGDVTPHLFSKDSGMFNGTYTQIASTCIDVASASATGNYVVFNGLTNDAILIRTAEPTGDYQAGKLMAFQIVPTPATPITTAPAFSVNPAYALSPVTLTEVAASKSAMTYQWQTDDGSGNFTNILNATSSNLVVIPPDQGFAYAINYACVVANSLGSVTSVTSVLNVNAASAPIVTRDTTPANIYAFAGGNVTFAAAFNGTQPITNQWQVNKGSSFTDFGPATTTNRNLVLLNVQAADSGSYQLVATNILGNLSTTPAILTVLADPPSLIPSQVSAYNVFSKSPVAYWRLNEVIDPTAAAYQAYDASGHNLNAIYGAGVTTGSPGPQSPAFAGFESTNTAASFSQNIPNGALVVPPLNLGSANVTITGWIYPTANEPAFGGLLFNRGPVDAAGLGFGGSTDTNTFSTTYGQAELGYNWNNNGSAYNFHSGLFPPLYTWSFVALTVTTTNATLYLCYFDGTTTNVFKKVNPIAHSLETFNSGTTWLGGDPSSNNKIFNGSIDEVAVFGSAFSDDQVMNLYFAAQGGGVRPGISSQPTSITTFAGQTITLASDGIGYPAATYQWQGGTGGVFHNLANDSHISGANSSILTIHTTIADSMDYQLVLANSQGSGTSIVATANLTPIPTNGLWTVNFAIIGPNNGAPASPYSGPGVLGRGTFWNGMSGGQFANSTSYSDDGATPSGINIAATNNPGSWFSGYPMHNALLDPYLNTQTGFVLTNVPNGIYNLAVYGISGTYLNSSRGTRFTVNGVSKDNVFKQDYFFADGDNTALFANVQVTNGVLFVSEEPIGTLDSSDPNLEPDFNGIQLQAVSLDPVTITPLLSGGNLTLNWPNYGTLLSATNLTGPWSPEAGAVAPYQVSPTNTAKFFRIKIH